MKVIEIIDPINNKKWLNFLESHKDSNIYHHPSWLSLLKEQYKFKVLSVCLTDKKEIVAGIPICEVRKVFGNKKWVSLPFTDHVYPLYNKESHLFLLLDFLIEEKKKRNLASLEIRYQLPQRSKFFQKTEFVLHKTTINISQDELFNLFKNSQVRQRIKKAIKEGLLAEIRRDKKAIEEFYKLHLLTRRKLGVPIQPQKYFIKLVKLLSLNLGFIVLIKKEELVIGAGVFLGFGKTIIFKYGASHPKYLRMRPNNLMLWEAMIEGKKCGFEIFDFGRTEISNKGLAKFKSGWGSNEDSLSYSYYPPQYESKLFNTINSKLVTPLIKNSPKFIGRLIGEFFYKFMG